MSRKMNCQGFGWKGSPLSFTKKYTLSGCEVKEGEESVLVLRLQ